MNWSGDYSTEWSHLLRIEGLHTEDLDEDATLSLVPPHPCHHHLGAGLVVLQLPVNLLDWTFY